MTNPTDLLDHIYDGYQLESVLTAAFEGSDYRFGTLDVHVRQPNVPKKYRIFPNKPERPGRTSYTVFGLQAVMHPQRGALLLGAAHVSADDRPGAVPRRIQERFDELIWLESIIRERFEEVEFWVDRPIVMGVGVVTGRRVAPGRYPSDVPGPAIIDREKLPNIAAHLDTLFDYYTTERAHPVDAWGPKLIEELTDHTAGVCTFIGEESLIDTYEEWGREFDGLVDSAA